MNATRKPQLLAVIRESECIGCTRCMQACPVDAILGSAQKMHTVIADECIGCKLCLPPCPVDCIDLLTLLPQNSEATHQKKAAHIKSRYVARQKRLAHNDSSTELDAQTYIKEAIARVKK